MSNWKCAFFATNIVKQTEWSLQTSQSLESWKFSYLNTEIYRSVWHITTTKLDQLPAFQPESEGGCRNRFLGDMSTILFYTGTSQLPTRAYIDSYKNNILGNLVNKFDMSPRNLFDRSPLENGWKAGFEPASR